METKQITRDGLMEVDGKMIEAWETKTVKVKPHISIKQRLADKVNVDLKLGAKFFAKNFCVNRGSQEKNDWCSWYAYALDDMGMVVVICSWSTMTELANKKTPLQFICKRTGEIA